MANIIGRTAFRRKGFELHIANLFKLRCEHGDDSFFDRNDAIRGYAREYLRDWIPVWESNAARKEAQARFDTILENALGYAHEWDEKEEPEELLFREVLGILQDDYPRHDLSEGSDDFSEEQMGELLDVYSLHECRLAEDLEYEETFDNVLLFDFDSKGKM